MFIIINKSKDNGHIAQVICLKMAHNPEVAGSNPAPLPSNFPIIPQQNSKILNFASWYWIIPYAQRAVMHAKETQTPHDKYGVGQKHDNPEDIEEGDKCFPCLSKDKFSLSSS